MNSPRTLVLAAVVVALAAASALFLWSKRAPAPLKVVEYAVGDGKDTPIAIAIGPDNAAWFTLDSVAAIGVLRDGKVARVPLHASSVEPLGIGVDARGTVFTTDGSGVAIQRIDPQGHVSAIPLGTPIARLGRLAIAPDGAAWFAEATAYSFTRLKDDSLTRNAFSSARGGPYGIAVAPDGVAWGTLQSGNQLVRVGLDGKLTEIEVPTRGSAPTDVVVDRDGAVWFVEFRGNKIGRYSQGRFEEYPMPEGVAGLSGIAAGPDRSIWFGVVRGGALGRVRDGKVNIYPLPRTPARPYSLAADAAGNIWYADLAGFIGMLAATEQPR